MLAIPKGAATRGVVPALWRGARTSMNPPLGKSVSFPDFTRCSAHLPLTHEFLGTRPLEDRFAVGNVGPRVGKVLVEETRMDCSQTIFWLLCLRCIIFSFVIYFIPFFVIF